MPMYLNVNGAYAPSLAPYSSARTLEGRLYWRKATNRITGIRGFVRGIRYVTGDRFLLFRTLGFHHLPNEHRGKWH